MRKFQSSSASVGKASEARLAETIIYRHSCCGAGSGRGGCRLRKHKNQIGGALVLPSRAFRVETSIVFLIYIFFFLLLFLSAFPIASARLPLLREQTLKKKKG